MKSSSSPMKSPEMDTCDHNTSLLNYSIILVPFSLSSFSASQRSYPLDLNEIMSIILNNEIFNNGISKLSLLIRSEAQFRLFLCNRSRNLQIDNILNSVNSSATITYRSTYRILCLFQFLPHGSWRIEIIED